MTSIKTKEANNGLNNVKTKRHESDKLRDNGEAGESPFCRKSPPYFIINIAEFLEHDKTCDLIVVEGDLLEERLEINKIEKRTGSIFVVENARAKFFAPQKTLVKSLNNVRHVLPTPEDCVKASSRGLIIEDLILRAEYKGRCRNL